MFYLRVTKKSGKIKEHTIYDDEIYTRCFDCGKEFQVETDRLVGVLSNDGDFSSTSICCDSCASKRIYK